MTTFVHYEGRLAAVVGEKRAFLTPEFDALPDGAPALRVIALMCAYALDGAQAEPRRPYSDEAALKFARGRLSEHD